MMAANEMYRPSADVWTRLSEPLPGGVVSWRQDGKPVSRDGRYYARFVAYVEANTVRERLDNVAPGEWDLTLTPLPVVTGDDSEVACAFKARLSVLGVVREDVGTGRDYKQAATDAFKRAAVRFGIAHELYAYETNWVEVDGDGKNPRPLEDPQIAYLRRYGPPGGAETEGAQSYGVRDNGEQGESADMGPAQAEQTGPALVREESALAQPECPKCGGRMWDNRLTKRNPRAPDYRCRNRACDGVIWPVPEVIPTPLAS